MRRDRHETGASLRLLAVALACGAGAATLVGGTPAARANLITNGSFETTTAGNTAADPSDITNSNLSGWTVSGGGGTPYDFVIGHQTNFVGAYGAAGFYNGYTSSIDKFNYNPGPSPDGGNYIAANADDFVGVLSQVLKGLTVGSQYAVSFYEAETTEPGYSDGVITGGWKVGFGAASQNSTPVVTTAYSSGPPVSGGGAGWIMDTLTFTATQASAALTFVATDSSGAPPFMLLDGVSVNKVPEPATLGLAVSGIACLLLMRRKRRAAAHRAAGRLTA